MFAFRLIEVAYGCGSEGGGEREMGNFDFFFRFSRRKIAMDFSCGAL